MEIKLNESNLWSRGEGVSSVVAGQKAEPEQAALSLSEVKKVEAYEPVYQLANTSEILSTAHGATHRVNNMNPKGVQSPLKLEGFSANRSLQLNREPFNSLRKNISRQTSKSTRMESWGSIHYDFETDLFYAESQINPEDIVPEAPLGVYWLVTAPCNLRCIHCYGNVEELPRANPNKNVQREIADRIIESGAMRVTLAGGEPLLRPDTPQIIEHLADHGIAVVLGTNGAYLKPEILKSIARTNLVEISLDSHNDKINNSIRISRLSSGNAYSDALAAVDLCIVNDIRVRVLTCLNKYNWADLEPMCDFLYARGVRDWGISWTLHAGRAKSIYAGLVPQDRSETRVLVEKLRLKYPGMKIKYSDRSDNGANNRFSCLVFPDGRVFAEDLVLGKKFGFHSLLDAPLVQSWTDANFNRKGHFKRWIDGRIISC
jgi:MoaA/NifB/PqqE/SkfB family radical SAM enzyme